MTSSQRALLGILSYSLFNCEYPRYSFSVDDVLEEARVQSVLLIVYNAVRKNSDYLNNDQKWSMKTARIIGNNTQVIQDHSDLHLLMKEAEIPYVILKGCASAYYYPDAFDRMMGDVDFLVPEEYLNKAGEILEQNGLKRWNDAHISHIVYRDNKRNYEMHFRLAGMPDGEAGLLVSDYIEDIYDSAVEYRLMTGNALLPSAFHHGLILLLHTCHHLTGEGIGLRQLCDWAVFSESFEECEFRSMFEDRLKKIGLWKFAQLLTLMSEKYLGSSHKKWAEIPNAETTIDQLMEDIFSSGNFGVKDNERQNQSYIISSRGKSGVGNNGMLKQFFISMNTVVYVHWPFTKKCKIFLPVGWIYWGTVHLFRIISGKRKKVHIIKMVNGAQERRALYNKLELFKPD